jgi:hypothetical protein
VRTCGPAHRSLLKRHIERIDQGIGFTRILKLEKRGTVDAKHFTSICPVVSPHLLRIVNNTEVSYFIQMSWKKNADADFEHALTQFFPRLWRYCLTLTGKRDRADDLA